MISLAFRFIVDLREMTNLCLQDPRSCDKGSAAIYGLAQSLPDRSIVDKLAWTYLDSLYITGNKTTKKQWDQKSHSISVCSD